jgi:integrase/recombinase XerD
VKVTTLVNDYVGFKRALGMRYRSEGAVLNAFARSMGDIEIVEVTSAAAQAFIAGHGPLTATWHKKFAALNGLYRFAINRDIVAISPLPVIVPRAPPPRIPYIYSVEELRRLVAATVSLNTFNCPARGATYRVLLLLLYGSALRISEALALTLNDVCLRERLLTVRETKFYKRRWVPIGPRLTEELRTSIEQRCHRPLPDGQRSAVFASQAGRRWSYSHVGTMFRRVRQEANVCRDGGIRSAPCLHDVRHTAAVHRVVHWYQAGENVQRLLLPLATFLGHVDIASTQRYLTMTPQLLQHAAQRFEEYACGELS